jgi:phosphatidylethanolamine-binding protein (PEBP) family uncharacterized protein
MRARSGLIALFGSIALAASCGGSDDTTGTGGHGGGTAGTSGGAGTTGSAGTSGNAGTSGGAGTSGIAGTSGTAGTTGSAGTTGAAGSTAGTTGSGGAAGEAGNGGGAGRGGTTGNGGSGGGRGGTTGSGGSGGSGGGTGGSSGGSGGGSSGTFSITSPMQMNGAKFDGKYTCNGGSLGAGVIPELDWTGVPAGTKSFVLTFIDTTLGENMSTGQHWAMYNIPWNATTMVVSKIPEATKTLSGDLASAKQVSPVGGGAFLAPCAQSVMNGMDDQYAFTLYALSTDTLAGSPTSVATVLSALKNVTPLGKAVLTGHAGLKGK